MAAALRNFVVPPWELLPEQFTQLCHTSRPQRSRKAVDQVLTCAKTVKWLEGYIEKIADNRGAMYFGRSNINEAIHNVYISKADKRHDFRRSYAARCDIALLENQLGRYAS